MRILVISPVGTHPVTAGNRKIILQYTSLFKHWGHEVYFLHIRLRSFRKEMRDRQWEEIQGTSSYWENHYIPFHEGSTSKLYRLFLIRYRRYFCKNYFKCDDTYPMGLCHFVNKLNEEYHFDACVVNYYMFSKVLNHVHIPRKALFTHDFFSYKDLVVGFKAGYATTPNEEAKAMQRAPYIFAMQDEEAAFFQRLSPLSKVLVNYSNYEYHFQPIIGNHNILFLSGPNIFNVNGIKWFISDILPEIITIYPDVIESAAAKTGKAHVIKSHHNVGGLPDDLKFKLVEPLRELFKDEVRRIGVKLGLPEKMVQRHPFPGPGLGVRVLGEVKREYLDLLRQADAIFMEELNNSGWYQKVSQAFTVFLPVRSVGVMGDGRRYDYVVALRAVKTIDFMTAKWAELPYDLLGRVSNRIINEVNGISRVVYDVSGKPPATIEWE